MKIELLCVVALVMVVQLPRQGDAVCCHGKGFAWSVKCKDCSKGTPFCARGKGCNIFGCNCMGGCREGPCPNTYEHHYDHVKPVYEAPAGRDFESSYESESDSAVPASDNYDVPATDVVYNSDPEMSSSTDKPAPIDCTYGCWSDEEPEINTADDVISTADEDGDGNMDIGEAERFLVKRGLAGSKYRAKRSLRSIDLNNDNLISAEEIELYE